MCQVLLTHITFLVFCSSCHMLVLLCSPYRGGDWGPEGEEDALGTRSGQSAAGTCSEAPSRQPRPAEQLLPCRQGPGSHPMTCACHNAWPQPSGGVSHEPTRQ